MKYLIIINIIFILGIFQVHAQGDIEAWAKNYQARSEAKAAIKPEEKPVPEIEKKEEKKEEKKITKPEVKPAPEIEKKKEKRVTKKEEKKVTIPRDIPVEIAPMDVPKPVEVAAPVVAAPSTPAPSPASDVPIVGFKDGISFEHKPSNFKTKFRFRIQSRFTYETEDDEVLKAKTVDFAARRVRLRLDGTVLDPRLLYRIQISFTRGDMDYDRTQYPNILRDAAVGWKLSDATTLWYGQTKLPGNRQRVVSSGSQQLVDRSIVTSTFNIDRDMGAQLYHRIGEDRPLWIKLAISNGEGRGTENKDNGLAYTSRMEWLPLGNFKDDGDYFEADLARETSPKLSFGGVYSVNKETTRPGGQLGSQYATAGLNRDIETYFVDALFKYQGFSLSSEYANRWTSDPYFKDGTKNVTVYKGSGFNAQAGYVLENNIEPSIRFSRLKADQATLQGSNDQKQYTLGLSKYINRHTVKVQGDLTYDETMNRLKETYRASWITRLQLEIGI